MCNCRMNPSALKVAGIVLIATYTVHNIIENSSLRLFLLY